MLIVRLSFVCLSELLKVQDEVATLRQVLGAKIKRENELKTLLGIGFVDDLKHDLNETVQDLKSTNAFQRTAETFHAATEKIAPTLQTMNSTLKSRLGLLRSKTKRNETNSIDIFHRFRFDLL